MIHVSWLNSRELEVARSVGAIEGDLVDMRVARGALWLWRRGLWS